MDEIAIERGAPASDRSPLARQRIAIIDYGMGNLRSVEKAFEKVGATGAFITEEPAEVASADKAVLPGDGSFDATMRSLRQSGVDRVSLDFIASGRPFLGICVGMQVLMTSSEEGEQGKSGGSLSTPQPSCSTIRNA